MEPKNRQKKTLGILEIEIHTNDTILKFDPNSMAYTVGTWDWKNPMTPVDGLRSELSKRPAYFVFFDDLKLSLSLSEIDRLFRHDLKKTEYKKLLEKYGNFYQISDNFYENCKPWQPMEISTEGKHYQIIENEISKKTKLKNQIDKKLVAKEDYQSKFKI